MQESSPESCVNAGWKQEWASLGRLLELAPQLRRSLGGGLGRATLKAMWLENGLQIRKSQSFQRGSEHSTEIAVSAAVLKESR